MSAIPFTNENIRALSKLEMSIRRESGMRHTMSQEQSLLQLIKLASISQSIEVQAVFFEFVQGLNKEQKSQLVYRGVSFQKSSAMPDPYPESTRSLERTYRGVKVTGPVKRQVSETAAEPAKKPKRIYRGREVT